METAPRRRWSWQLGTLFGIAIRIHVTLLVLMVVVAFAAPIGGTRISQAILQWLLVAAVFACVLVHELSHALVARRYGCVTREILLLPIGGLAQVERMPERPSQEMRVALAGPATNVAIAGVLAAILWLAGLPFGPEQPGDASALLASLFWINVSLAAFNLLPAFPMDGGRVFRAALACHFDRVKATRIASVLGKVIAALFVLVGLSSGGTMLALIGVFVWFASSQESAVVALASSLGRATVADAMPRDPHVVDAGVSVDVAAEQMLAAGASTLGVLEAGELRGYVTARDLAPRILQPPPHVAVAEAMHRDAPLVAPTLRLDRVLDALDRSGIVFVGDREHVLGLLTAEQLATFAALREEAT